MPVIAPRGESNKDKPRLPSVKASRCLIPGMAATQVPNKRLEVENKKPTARAGFILIKEDIFFIMGKSKFTTSDCRKCSYPNQLIKQTVLPRPFSLHSTLLQFRINPPIKIIINKCLI
jgi:hypothetical protein